MKQWQKQLLIQIGVTIVIVSTFFVIAFLIFHRNSSHSVTEIEKKVITVGFSGKNYPVLPDYEVDGIDDDLQVQQALDILPASGGTLVLYAGNWKFSTIVTRPIDNVMITGVGDDTYIVNDGKTPVFSAGKQTGWKFMNFRTDQGGIQTSVALDTVVSNVKAANDAVLPDNQKYSSIVVAGYDAPNEVKSNADYVADGIDDEDTIQTAINSRTSGSWQTISLVGSFVTSSPITMESYIILNLNGKLSLKQNANCDMIVAENESHFQIIGGEWNGNKSEQSVNANAFVFVKCTEVTVLDCQIHDFKKINGVNGGNGIEFVHCTSSIALSNHIYNMGDPDINANGVGIFLIGNCEDNYIGKNNIHDCDGGIYLYVNVAGQINKNNIVLDNVIKNISRDGVSLYNDGNKATVGWNIVTNNSFLDVGLDGAHPSIVVGNGGESEHNTITRNIINYTEDNGKTNNGIIICSNYNTVLENVVTNAEIHGITIDSANYNIISGNTVDNPNSQCIYILHASQYNTIQNNNLSYGETGIMTTDEANSYNQISGNWIRAMSYCGIKIQGRATSNTIEGNHFSEMKKNIEDTGVNTIIRNN